MNDHAQLERRYRRLLAFYPREFRRDHEEEMLIVLLACSRDGLSRPGLADTANLLWNAVRLQLRPTAQRSLPTVFWAVRLMVLAAVLELVALVTVLASQSAVKASIAHSFPHLTAPHTAAMVHAQVVAVVIGAPIAAAIWLLLAWANDRGLRWSRAGAALAFTLTTISLLSAVGHHAPAYALADVIIGVGLCVVALAAALLIISTDSNHHYSHPSGQRPRSDPKHLRPPHMWHTGQDNVTWN